MEALLLLLLLGIPMPATMTVWPELRNSHNPVSGMTMPIRNYAGNDSEQIKLNHRSSSLTNVVSESSLRPGVKA